MSKSSSDLLNVSGKKKTIEDLINPLNSVNVVGGDAKPLTLNGTSDILSRVQSFLPQIKKANEQLEKEDPKKLDIENVEEETEQYIEMNLGLGVYEEKKPGESDSEEDEDDINGKEKLIIPNLNQPTLDNKSKKPMIQELDKQQ